MKIIDNAAAKGTQTSYFYADCIFELAELKLFVDVVESSKFITAKKSEALVRKLTSMTAVKLMCSDPMMNYVIDRFGDELKTRVVDAQYFMAEMEV